MFKVSETLERVSSVTWALLFLFAALVVFPALYMALPVGSFYFVTSAREPSASRAYAELGRLLRSDLTIGFVLPEDPFGLADTKAWGVVDSQIVIKDITVSPAAERGVEFHTLDDIPLEVSWYLPSENDGVGQFVLQCISELRVNKRELFPEFSLRGLPDTTRARLSEPIDVVTPFPTKILDGSFTLVRVGLPPPPPLSNREQWSILRRALPSGALTEPLISLSPPTRKALYAYTRQMLGYPIDWKDNALRLVYLSMITITTVGYGDILPLTTAARVLTGTEAILGLVLLGFFLNSVAVRASTRRAGTARD